MWHEAVFRNYGQIIWITLIHTIFRYGQQITNDSNDFEFFVILIMTLVTMNHWSLK